MDETKANSYRKTLRTQREVLLGQVRIAEAYNRERDSEAVQDSIDMANDSHSKSLLASMSAMDRQLLISIDGALELLAKGEYGNCLHCGKVINEKRLEAIPWAKHCLRCQDLNEKGLLISEEDGPWDIVAEPVGRSL